MDAVIILAAVLELCLEPALSRSSDGGSGVRLLKTLQLLRLMRLFRLGRIFGSWRPLRVILQAISKAWMNVAAAGIFIGIQWLTFAILTTSVIRKQAEAGEGEERVKEVMLKYFSSVPRSFLTALEATVGGVEWG